jgi:HrpA-like RNA helicase
VGYQIGMESRRGDKTRLTYMTYGILIQELLFKDKIQYDFIILDEVHERSLEMDLTFVILKKLINE